MSDDLSDLQHAITAQKYFHVACETTDPDVIHIYQRLVAYEIQIDQVVMSALSGSKVPKYDIHPDTKLDDELIATIGIKVSELQTILRQYQKYKANLDNLLLLANKVLENTYFEANTKSKPNTRYRIDPLEEVPMEDKSSLTPIYQAVNKFEAETIRLLLESFEIPVELIGESVGKTMGLGGGPLGEVVVYVPADRAKEACDIITRMDKGEFELGSSNPDDTSDEPA